jgi:hypothetical protein
MVGDTIIASDGSVVNNRGTITDSFNTVERAVDLTALSEQLRNLRAEMKRTANPEDAERDAEIGAVAQAEKAAKRGDQRTALGLLRGASKWTLDVAKSVTAHLVQDAIEGKFGS